MTKQIPAVGSLVRPTGSKLTYRVASAHEHGCYVEVADAAGSTLRYDEKRFTLACCRNTGMLFDGQWRAWEAVA